LGLGRLQVKGVVEPVGVFDLEGAGAHRTRLDRSRARGLSAFVGRDRDMALLGVYGGMNENFVLVAGRSRWQADGV